MRKLILYISQSLDGYLAAKDDDLSWLSIVEQPGEDYGYAAFNEQIDTYLVGRRTYEVVLKLTGGSFPQAQQHNCYVLTRQPREPENGVTFYSGNPCDLVRELKTQPGKHIYCDGGAEIVRLLMAENLIDEYIVSVIPILLGDGIRLFKGGTPRIELEAKPSKHFESGLVQLHYVRRAKSTGNP